MFGFRNDGKKVKGMNIIDKAEPFGKLCVVSSEFVNKGNCLLYSFFQQPAAFNQ